MPKLDTAQHLAIPLHAPEHAHVPSQTLAYSEQYSRSGLFDRGSFRQDLRDRVLHAEAFLCALAVVDVYQETVPAGDMPGLVANWGAAVFKPSIFAVKASQA